MAVILLLKQRQEKDSSVNQIGIKTNMDDYIILRIISKFFIPVIILFALYVQFHGDFGPGGGFQAGVIFASAFVLYGLVFSNTKARKIIPHRMLICLVAGAFYFTLERASWPP